MTTISDLLSVLPRGSEHPAPARELAELLHIGQREVGALVSEARKQGVIVGSSCDPLRPGYFLALSLDEAVEGTSHLFKRARETFAIARAVRQAAIQRFGMQTETLFSLDEVAS